VAEAVVTLQPVALAVAVWEGNNITPTPVSTERSTPVAVGVALAGMD
jgi:hypothetical protein